MCAIKHLIMLKMVVHLHRLLALGHPRCFSLSFVCSISYQASSNDSFQELAVAVLDTEVTTAFCVLKLALKVHFLN